jgi:regulator of RNase E activity RraA
MSSQKPRSADVHPGPGFRVRTSFHRLPRARWGALAGFDVPDVSDALNRLYALDSAITCRTRETALIGLALTVRVFPGDNLMVHKTLDLAQPGDVVVIDAHGDRCTNAVLGDIICTKAKHRGIAGFVVDGLIRDLPGIDPLGIPVYARGTTAVGPLHRGPGEINFPIACGGVVISPGDVIVASPAGVVSVPRESVDEVLARLTSQRARQTEYLAAVARGEFSNEWVDRMLDEQGCPIEDAAERAPG